MECPDCQLEVSEDSNFCKGCGHKLIVDEDGKTTHPEIGSERKHVTIMFSDLSGYTAMTEKLDPEDVKEIMSGIFGEITQIIKKYNGFIEKFLGDAVMAVFGIPKAHEDDPVRAIRAAIEIHSAVEAFSPQLKEIIGRPLTMHTGINTGLVVTGEVDVEKGTHGLTGDAINLASRLEGIADSGEIVVGPDTFTQSFNYFEFETLEPTKVKGKQEPVKIYRFCSIKEDPFKIHRFQGLRADLIGRDDEMAILSEAVERLKTGEGSVITISGDAGTGKSRLKREFKETLDLKEIQWREGHAFGYTQNIPYFPLVNLLTHAFQINEEDPPDRIKAKVESGTAYLLSEGSYVIPYIGSLFALDYPEIEGISPEWWKDKVQESVQALLEALIEKGPTIVCFEDLHWADPSFIELLHRLLRGSSSKALFICTYRSYFSLFENTPTDEMVNRCHDIRLKDLAELDANEMLKSLLDAHNIPEEIYDIAGKKAEGNPFFIEEIINSLIESDVLARDNGNWKLTRQITEDDVPASIQGVLTARVDRLGKPLKRILQEASVIGRAFLYKILDKITNVDAAIDQYLSGLENLDLIRSQSMAPELEYIFKHALTQEVVYSGLLKKERQEIHERIGLTIEKLFAERLEEFYETLAYHFSRGRSMDKAVEYLMRSGEKSLARYALEESNQYYTEGYTLINEIPNKKESENELLIDLLMKWALVFYYKGEFRKLTGLFEKHIETARKLSNSSKYGMVRAWLGFALLCRNRTKDSYEYLTEALEIGQKINDQKLIGYACTWLPWTCAYYGLFEEAIELGERAQKISKDYPWDHYMYFKSLGGLALVHYLKGNKKEVLKLGQRLVDFGRKQSNIRSYSMGMAFISGSYALEGKAEEGQKVALDPFYEEYGRQFYSRFYLLNNQIDKAEKSFQQSLKFGDKFGVEALSAVSHVFLGVIQISKGQMSQGMKLLQKGQQECAEGHMVCEHCLSEYLRGYVYLQMVQKTEPINFYTVIKNIVFLIKNVPFATQKAECHFTSAINIAKRIGANSILGPAYLDLGNLYSIMKKSDKAKDCISEAIKIFDDCETSVYLAKAKKAFETIQ